MLIALIGGVVVAAGAPTPARADGGGRLKAVIIVGPTDGATSSYLSYGRSIARTARRNGMAVARVFHPDATWRRVKRETRGANLVIYLGHGFGYPSPYGPMFESQQNGFGLNFPDPDRRGSWDTHYYGAAKIRESLRFAPNAIVILNHLCYASGHGEMHHARPSRDVAVKRVDNFANGFLKVGASTVFALAYQPPESMIDWLHGAGRNTMEDLFRKRRSSAGDSAAGWVGWSPSRHDSVRTPGARLLLDPHPSQSYRRAVSGDLGMTVAEWRGSPGPDPEPDSTSPELSDLTATAGGETAGPGAEEPVSFSPDGDGHADRVSFDYRVSEPGSVDFTVHDVRPEGDVEVHRFSTQSGGGAGSASWDGRRDDGTVLPDGRYRISAIARDSAENPSAPAEIDVRILSLVRSPSWDARAFHPGDGDELASSAGYSVSVERESMVQVTIRDAAGNPVRSLHQSDTPTAPGPLGVAWNGKDDTGTPVQDGAYSAVVAATTEQGTQRFVSEIWVGQFRLSLSDVTPRRGQRVRFNVIATEAQQGPPTLRIRQPGHAAYTRTMVETATPDQYRAALTLMRGGRAGELVVTVSGTDVGGQTDSFTRRYGLR